MFLTTNIFTDKYPETNLPPGEDQQNWFQIGFQGHARLEQNGDAESHENVESSQSSKSGEKEEKNGNLQIDCTRNEKSANGGGKISDDAAEELGTNQGQLQNLGKRYSCL